MYKYFILALYLLNFIECGKRYCTNKRPVTSIDLDADNDTCKLYDPGEIENHLPLQECSYTWSKKAKIINHYKNARNNSEDVDIFKSACIKCAACLAIAQNMNDTFQEHCSNYHDKDSACLCNILGPTCAKGFKNYDLREINGNALLTATSAQSKHISTNLDGSWSKKLRETCFNYLKYINCDIQHYLKTGSINFVEYLCRGEGIFRDCKNIDMKSVEIPNKKNEISIKLCVTCS